LHEADSNPPPPRRILIVEDSPDRQEVLTNLYRGHAWVLVNTASRARTLLSAFTFDLISLDYDLAGGEKGDAVAETIAASSSAGALVIVHSMNAAGADRIRAAIPEAVFAPISKMTRDNATFRRLQEQLRSGASIDWAAVFRRDP
jgi:CheY-like chemotaxis protein